MSEPLRCRLLGHRLRTARRLEGAVFAWCRRLSCDHESGPWPLPFAEVKARGGTLRGVKRED